MAVTDLTDSMPWWARGGAGAPSGATGGPGAAPMGAGGLPGGPDGQAWLQYLSSMFGITTDQAATMMQGGANPADMPSPNATPMEADTDDHGTGDNPPVTPFAVPPKPPMTNFGNPAPVTGPGPGNVGPVNLNAANVGQPPAASAGPPVGAGMLDQSGVHRVGGPNGVLATQPRSPPVGASLLDQSGVTRNPAGVLSPGAPATPAGTSAPAAPAARVPGPLASGGAAGSAATSNPRFIGLDYRPNASPQNSMRAGPQATALNLAGLFGQGQPAVNPNAPAANAQPVAAQRTVPGPLASAPMPPVMPGDIRNQRVKNAIANPNWWQNL
jgi:hypothetical protein